mmetsp:Transcript_50326/g.69847  ORF Transcript_50326/g.69847 Transcript_50326/m.69847 type:complete len:132 (-) Transcript_50326:120-515(-)
MASIRSRIQRLADGWPVVPARGKRDFGAYVQDALSKRLLRFVKAGTPDSATKTFVEGEVEALSQLRNNEFKAKYARVEDTTFTGKQGEQYGWAKLSAKAQEAYNAQSFFDRLFGRSRPSQHTKETAHRSGK